jgi:hypothetical protein
VKSLLKRIHDRTTRRWYADHPENTVARPEPPTAWLVRLPRSGAGHGYYNLIREYVDRRLRHWLVNRRPQSRFRANMSRTSHSWSTARQRYIPSLAIRTTIWRVARGNLTPTRSQNRT